MSKIVNYSDLEHLNKVEEDGQYLATIVFNGEKFSEIQKENIDLKEGANIRKENKLKNTLNKFTRRENIIYLGKTCLENSINIKDTNGSTSLQLINLEDILKVKKQIKNRGHRL